MRISEIVLMLMHCAPLVADQSYIRHPLGEVMSERMVITLLLGRGPPGRAWWERCGCPVHGRPKRWSNGGPPRFILGLQVMITLTR